MPCSPLPAPPAPPALPGGISLEPDLPTPELDEKLCCKTFTMPSLPDLVSLPPGAFNSGLAATIDELLAQIVAHCHGRPIPCAKE